MAKQVRQRVQVGQFSTGGVGQFYSGANNYLNLTRMTWPKQRLHVGYGGADAKGFVHLPEPGSEKYDTIDVSKVDFGTQLAGLVVTYCAMLAGLCATDPL